MSGFKVVVDMELCQDYGQCVIAAPNVFDLDESGSLVFVAHPSPDELDNVEAAIDACPFQAITRVDE
jgi:ferredoxin